MSDWPKVRAKSGACVYQRRQKGLKGIKDKKRWQKDAEPKALTILIKTPDNDTKTGVSKHLGV